MAEHAAVIYDEVLASIEEEMCVGQNFTRVPVMILQSDSGTTLFMLKSYESTYDSLDKAMNWFASQEEYEKAARARDAKTFIQEKEAEESQNF
jgi:hypothetical protein